MGRGVVLLHAQTFTTLRFSSVLAVLAASRTAAGRPVAKELKTGL